MRVCHIELCLFDSSAQDSVPLWEGTFHSTRREAVMTVTYRGVFITPKGQSDGYLVWDGRKLTPLFVHGFKTACQWIDEYVDGKSA